MSEQVPGRRRQPVAQLKETPREENAREEADTACTDEAQPQRLLNLSDQIRPSSELYPTLEKFKRPILHLPKKALKKPESATIAPIVETSSGPSDGDLR